MEKVIDKPINCVYFGWWAQYIGPNKKPDISSWGTNIGQMCDTEPKSSKSLIYYIAGFGLDVNLFDI